VKEVQASIRQEMVYVSTKETFCHTFVSVKFNGVSLLQSKFEGLTLFRNVTHEGVDTMLVTVAYLHYPVDDSHREFTYVTLRDTACH
jgi:hypothetical protein